MGSEQGQQPALQRDQRGALLKAQQRFRRVEVGPGAVRTGGLCMAQHQPLPGPGQHRRTERRARRRRPGRGLSGPIGNISKERRESRAGQIPRQGGIGVEREQVTVEAATKLRLTYREHTQ